MKIGMPILYEFNSIEENIRLAKELKLDFLELNLNFDYCRKEIMSNEKIKSLEEGSMMYTLHFFDEADFGSYDEVVTAYLKLLKKYLEKGKNYIKIVNIHLNEGPVVTINGVKNYLYEKEYDLYIKRIIKNLTKAKKICELYNIHMVIENVKTLDYIEKVYVELNKNKFMFNFDIGHDALNGNKSELMMEKYRFTEMHIHDVSFDKKQDHLSLGSGDLNIKHFKDKAKEDDCFVVIEVKKKEDLIDSVKYFNNI